MHFYRNVFSHVPATKVREVSHMLKAIHAQETRATAEAKASAVVDELRRQRMGRAADLVDAHVAETLTYYAFPDCHWIKIRTNNPLERIMREIRRRTRVVGAFPDGQSCLNLAAARLRHIAGTQWSTRKYMNMAPLRAAEERSLRSRRRVSESAKESGRYPHQRPPALGRQVVAERHRAAHPHALAPWRRRSCRGCARR